MGDPRLRKHMVTSQSTPSETNSTEGKNSTSGWLTREECARLVGVSTQTIIAYEKRGLLHPLQEPRQDSRGRTRVVTVHDPQEIVSLRGKLLTKTQQGGAIDTSTWLTRNEACDSLSIATQTLKNYEHRGQLHPLRAARRDARGHEQMVIVYDPKELHKLPRGAGRPFTSREPGELEAQCFELIEQGQSNREIVIALRTTSDKIRELRERWENDGGADLMITRVAKEALEGLIGPFKDVTQLVEIIKTKLQSPTDGCSTTRVQSATNSSTPDTST